MSVETILADLRRERAQLDRAIAALEGTVSTSGKSTMGARAGKMASSGKRRGGLTPAGRKRLSEAMKRRWAERRKRNG